MDMLYGLDCLINLVVKLTTILFLVMLFPFNCIAYICGYAFSGLKNAFQNGMRNYNK